MTPKRGLAKCQLYYLHKFYQQRREVKRPSKTCQRSLWMSLTVFFCLQFLFIKHVSSSIEDLAKLLSFEKNMLLNLKNDTSPTVLEYVNELDYK